MKEDNDNLVPIRINLNLEGVSLQPTMDGSELRTNMANAQRNADALIVNGVPVQMDPTSIKAFLDCIPGVYDELQAWFTDQQHGLKNIWVTLAQHGWAPVPSLTFRQQQELANAIPHQLDVVDELISDHVRNHLDATERQLTESYPERSQLFREAFEAHRMGVYSLSIPAFIIQADGISYDRLKNSLFVGRERQWISEQFDNSNPESGLTPLIQRLFEEQLPFWMTRKQRDDHFDELNRHLVLHGISTTYNTEEFSLKAIALVSWLSFALTQLHDDDIAGLSEAPV